MRVIVTGRAGFLGSLLARRLLAGAVAIRSGEAADVAELVLADLAMPDIVREYISASASDQA